MIYLFRKEIIKTTKEWVDNVDGLIIIILLLIIAFYFRRFDKFVTSIAIIDIFLRVFNYIITHIEIDGISEYIERYLPISVPNIIGNYTTDIIFNILMWLYVICMAIFLYYTIRHFFKTK